MANVSFQSVAAVASNASTQDYITVYEAASAMRRFKVYDLIVAAGVAGDGVLTWQVIRRTTIITTPAAITGQSLDPADTTFATLGAGPTSGAAGTSGGIALTITHNQRASFRWVAAPGSELMSPATASNGYGLNTPAPTPLTASTATVFINEY